MADNRTDARNFTGRRNFLKSLLGLGGVLETQPASVQARPAGHFFWADLKTGQVGFPTGTTIPQGLPGSIMKLVAAAYIREHNLLPLNETIDCVGSVSIKGKKYTCQVAHGPISLVQAIGHSCNVYFARASELFSADAFLDCARSFGLNSPVAGFASGLFPAIASAETQAYVMGKSEELQPNALQIMQLAGLIGARGVLPALHSAEDPPGTAVTSAPSFAVSTWNMLNEGMQIACREGTARSLDPENKLHIAAKTGTAPHGKTFQSWITGFFPYESPRHAFCLRAMAGTSQEQAVPMARKYLFATTWP